MLGAVAEATTRVELGPLVLCTPFRNAGLIAWMANTLDEIRPAIWKRRARPRAATLGPSR